MGSSRYTDEFRRETADYIIESGRSVTIVCSEVGLNPKTVNRWVINRKHERSGRPERNELQARKRIGELEKENDFLKYVVVFYAKK